VRLELRALPAAATNTAVPSWLERRLGRGRRGQIANGSSSRASGRSWRRRGRCRNGRWRRCQCRRNLGDGGWAGSDRPSTASQDASRAGPATHCPTTLFSPPGARRRSVPRRGLLHTPGLLGVGHSLPLIGEPLAVPVVGPWRQQHRHRGGRRRQGRHGGRVPCPAPGWGGIAVAFASCRAFVGLACARLGLRLLALPAQHRRARLRLVDDLKRASPEHGSLPELREPPVLDPTPRAVSEHPSISLSALARPVPLRRRRHVQPYPPTRRLACSGSAFRGLGIATLWIAFVCAGFPTKAALRGTGSRTDQPACSSSGATVTSWLLVASDGRQGQHSSSAGWY
jgi:hypothetical protein